MRQDDSTPHPNALARQKAEALELKVRWGFGAFFAFASVLFAYLGNLVVFSAFLFASGACIRLDLSSLLSRFIKVNMVDSKPSNQ